MASDYDDYYIIPKGMSGVNSRDMVDLTSDLCGIYPIISSPMAGISGPDLVCAMAHNNCLGILHRFQESQSKRLEDIDAIRDANVPFGIAIGINNFEQEMEVARYAVDRGAVLICVDVANGYMSQLFNIGTQLRESFPSMQRMCGNVITHEGVQHLALSGFNFVRVGIGGGNLCTTRRQTGVGRNNIEAIKDCYKSNIAYVVADGGIDEPGKAAKSFVAGASFVMMGTALAYAEESEHVINHKDNIYGMASRANHVATNKEIKSIEGKDMYIDPHKIVPLKDIIDEFLGGIKSTCTYCNSFKYTQLKYRAELIHTDE